MMIHSLYTHAQIVAKNVKSILVDTGASVDILYWDAFEQLRIAPEALKPDHGRVVSICRDSVNIEGTIKL